MDELPRKHFAAILADPPWQFKFWSEKGRGNRDASAHYDTMSMDDLGDLPVESLAAENCALFMWIGWPYLKFALHLIERWGFEYKTCAFDWVKADTQQFDMFRSDAEVQIGLGWWTRANSEPCLLATRGKPKRLNADVRQAIIEPRREHSRKPDCVYDRIERLVAGPYLELFARTQRYGWSSWGNETSKYPSLARGNDATNLSAGNNSGRLNIGDQENIHLDPS